jgi:HSP20 family molecular chaperone IbpA
VARHPFISLVSSVVESVSAPSPARSHEVRPPAGQSPVRLGGGSALAGVRDPVVDLFDEGVELVLVIEWPYGNAEQLRIDVEDDVVSLAFGGEWPFSTDILLPGVVDPASLRRSSRNGITEVRLRRV